MDPSTHVRPAQARTEITAIPMAAPDHTPHWGLALLWAMAGVVLIGLGTVLSVTSSWMCVSALHADCWRSALVIANLVAGVLFLAVCLALRRAGGGRRLLLWILFAGLLCRLVLVGATPVLATDWCRYLWDGAVITHGASPWSISPQRALLATSSGQKTVTPDLIHLAQAHRTIMAHINHAKLPTIYPPLAEGFFALAALIHPFSVGVLKAVYLAVDLIVLFLLMMLLKKLDLPRVWCAIYWWNPVVINAFYNEAHMDVLVLPWVLLALLLALKNRPISASGVLGAAVAAKFWPVVLLPVLWRRRGIKFKTIFAAGLTFAAISAIGLLPMLWSRHAGFYSVLIYGRYWYDNSGLFHLQYLFWKACAADGVIFGLAPGILARISTVIIFLAVLAGVVRQPRDGASLCRGAVIVVAAVFMLSPTEFPWYYTWLAPLLALWPVWPWLAYSLTLGLYHWHTAYPWIIWLEHGPIWLLLVYELVRWRRRAAQPRSEIHAPMSNDLQNWLPADCKVAVIIPALNEERSIALVIRAIPSWVHTVIVADNGSTDRTAVTAEAYGARVVRAVKRGYGSACLAGIAAAPDADILVFLDGDFSDYPEQMDRLVRPITQDDCDLALGSRVLGRSQPGALTPQQRLGGGLACVLMRWLWGRRYTDLGPFRAIRNSSLKRLRMDDHNFGWTVQMQIRAVRAKLRIREAPVDYRRRIGNSKISGTITGVAKASYKIIYTIAREYFRGD